MHSYKYLSLTHARSHTHKFGAQITKFDHDTILNQSEWTLKTIYFFGIKLKEIYKSR